MENQDKYTAPTLEGLNWVYPDRYNLTKTQKSVVIGIYERVIEAPTRIVYKMVGRSPVDENHPFYFGTFRNQPGMADFLEAHEGDVVALKFIMPGEKYYSYMFETENGDTAPMLTVAGAAVVLRSTPESLRALSVTKTGIHLL